MAMRNQGAKPPHPMDNAFRCPNCISSFLTFSEAVTGKLAVYICSKCSYMGTGPWYKGDP